MRSLGCNDIESGEAGTGVSPLTGSSMDGTSKLGVNWTTEEEDGQSSGLSSWSGLSPFTGSTGDWTGDSTGALESGRSSGVKGGDSSWNSLTGWKLGDWKQSTKLSRFWELSLELTVELSEAKGLLEKQQLLGVGLLERRLSWG